MLTVATQVYNNLSYLVRDKDGIFIISLETAAPSRIPV